MWQHNSCRLEWEGINKAERKGEFALVTGKAAAERIAGATEALSATVFRTARTLREAGNDLWPEAGKGGGRAAAHVERRHLTNLAIALAVNEPLLAVKFIPVYRSLVPDKPERHATTQDSGQVASLLATNGLFNGKRRLGDELDRLLDVLAKGRIAEELENAGLYFEFYIEQRVPRAVVGFHVFDPLDVEDLTKPEIRWLYRRPHMSSNRVEYDPNFSFLPPLLITRTALIPVSLFVVMSELWLETQRHHAKTTARRSRRPAVLIEE